MHTHTHIFRLNVGYRTQTLPAMTVFSVSAGWHRIIRIVTDVGNDTLLSGGLSLIATVIHLSPSLCYSLFLLISFRCARFIIVPSSSLCFPSLLTRLLFISLLLFCNSASVTSFNLSLPLRLFVHTELQYLQSSALVVSTPAAPPYRGYSSYDSHVWPTVWHTQSNPLH